MQTERQARGSGNGRQFLASQKRSGISFLALALMMTVLRFRQSGARLVIQFQNPWFIADGAGGGSFQRQPAGVV